MGREEFTVIESSPEERILKLIPHQPPFRFIDRILSLEGKTIRSSYRFREEEYFYAGHFPRKPITPGVILLETMAQTGLVALGIALMLRQEIPAQRIRQSVLLFAMADDVRFDRIVYPGQTVLIEGRNLFFRSGTIRSEVRVSHEGGQGVCSALLTGMACRGSDA
jgi:3-hydroxyacyl-[acyl-carrier-protein] dehydratase